VARETCAAISAREALISSVAEATVSTLEEASSAAAATVELISSVLRAMPDIDEATLFSSVAPSATLVTSCVDSLSKSLVMSSIFLARLAFSSLA